MRHLIPFMKRPPLVSVLRLGGMIASGARIGAFNDAGMAPLIERAFRRGKPVAVALLINSPGGSPAQSSLIAARIRRLAEEKEVKVYAFVEDLAASGGYWLATAADEIWLDRNSIVGSIGVISASFGFHEFLGRHGVERRVYTAGKAKGMLDPFRPEDPTDVKRLKELQKQIHASFIEQVKERRGDRLDGTTDLFTGDIWVGEKAVEVGLADGIGHATAKMKEVYGDKVRLRIYGQKRSLFQRLGAQVLGEAAAAFEERSLYSRFGL